MSGLTRRGFVASAAMSSLMAGVAQAQTAQAAANSDPYAYVDPELAEVLRQLPTSFEAPNADNLASLRGRGAIAAVSDAPELQPKKTMVRGASGEVPVLLIDPRPGAKNKAATIYIHGGGYVMGQAGASLHQAQEIAQATGGLVVSVDYTLAPEARFPLSLEQNYAALAWAHRNADALGIDPRRIAVCGDSAGGGHAAMLAIAARDRREFSIAFQCLIYPMLDDRTGSTNRMPPYIGHFIWTAEANRFGWSALLGVPAGSASVPAGSVPARVTDLAGLAPAFIGVGSIDLFCPEDMDYAKRLLLAGVPTELFVVPGAYHGFDLLAPNARATIAFKQAWQSALRRGLGIAV